jgi:hypothetical protein
MTKPIAEARVEGDFGARFEAWPLVIDRDA